MMGRCSVLHACCCSCYRSTKASSGTLNLHCAASQVELQLLQQGHTTKDGKPSKKSSAVAHEGSDHHTRQEVVSQ